MLTAHVFEMKTISLQNTLVTGNGGAGILAVYTKLTLNEVSISDNQGDGILARTRARLAMRSSEFTDNARNGIALSTGMLDVQGSTVSHNGRYGISSKGKGARTIHESSIADNKRSGIFVGEGTRALGVINTTLKGNRGGIVVEAGSLNVLNSTIANNSLGRGGGILQKNQTSSRVEIENSIVSGNETSALSNRVGKPVSLGHNIFDSLEGCGITPAKSDLVMNTQLGAWVENSTPASGHYPLLPTSPAIRHAKQSACPALDQSGNLRAGRCDTGAVEYILLP